MKYFTGPLSTRRRDKDVKALVRRGHATDDELFEAQFGEWPVRGMTKDTPCTDIIHFKGFHCDRKLNPLSYLFSNAYTRKEDEHDRTIYLNGLLLSPLAPVVGIAASRLAFARLHDLAGIGILAEAPIPLLLAEMAAATFFSSYRYAIASSMTRLFALSLADIVGEEQIHIKQFKEDNRSIARAAFQNSADDWLKNQDFMTRNITMVKQTVDALLTLMPISYFSADYELQARLHNIIVRGYPAWGKIPENVDELYVALQDMGIKSPSRVSSYYNDDAFDGIKSVFYRHAAGEGFVNAPNAEMNIGLNSFRNPDILETYWRDCLPMLYGDLLQRKYGDSRGLAKMNFSQELDVLGIPILESDIGPQPSSPV